MNIIKIILALVVMAASAYGVITKKFSYGPISSFLLGIFIAIIEPGKCLSAFIVIWDIEMVTTITAGIGLFFIMISFIF